ncbi:hypothetical protein MC885_016465 [Smutsia gigantea]|nr:hypothetical protein MC885_016465 [Smutsia gigantea]
MDQALLATPCSPPSCLEARSPWAFAVSMQDTLKDGSRACPCPPFFPHCLGPSPIPDVCGASAVEGHKPVCSWPPTGATLPETHMSPKSPPTTDPRFWTVSPRLPTCGYHEWPCIPALVLDPGSHTGALLAPPVPLLREHWIWAKYEQRREITHPEKPVFKPPSPGTVQSATQVLRTALPGTVALGRLPNYAPQTSAEAMLALPQKRERREGSGPACGDSHPHAQGGSHTPEQDGCLRPPPCVGRYVPPALSQGAPLTPCPCLPRVLRGLSMEAWQRQRAVVKSEVRAEGTRGGPEVFQQKRREPGQGSALPSYGRSRGRDVRRCRGLSCPRAVSGSSALRSPDGCPRPGDTPARRSMAASWGQAGSAMPGQNGQPSLVGAPGPERRGWLPSAVTP